MYSIEIDRLSQQILSLLRKKSFVVQSVCLDSVFSLNQSLFRSAMQIYYEVGTWRSLVAHYAGGVGVAGSNPVVPTIVFTF